MLLLPPFLLLKLATITMQSNITFVQSSGQSSIPQHHLQLPLILKFVSHRVFDILIHVWSFKQINRHLTKGHKHKSTIRTFFMFWGNMLRKPCEMLRMHVEARITPLTPLTIQPCQHISGPGETDPCDEDPVVEPEPGAKAERLGPLRPVDRSWDIVLFIYFCMICIWYPWYMIQKWHTCSNSWWSMMGALPTYQNWYV